MQACHRGGREGAYEAEGQVDLPFPSLQLTRRPLRPRPVNVDRLSLRGATWRRSRRSLKNRPSRVAEHTACKHSSSLKCSPSLQATLAPQQSLSFQPNKRPRRSSALTPIAVMARAQLLALVVLASLALLSLASAARIPHSGLFASAVDLPAGSHNMLSTRMSEIVSRRQLGEGSAAGYGYGGYGYGYGYSYGYSQGSAAGYGYGYGNGYGYGYYSGYGL